MNIPFRQVLEWNDFTKVKPHKGTGPCLFSDGVIHRVGWWSVTEGGNLLAKRRRHQRHLRPQANSRLGRVAEHRL